MNTEDIEDQKRYSARMPKIDQEDYGNKGQHRTEHTHTPVKAKRRKIVKRWKARFKNE